MHPTGLHRGIGDQEEAAVLLLSMNSCFRGSKKVSNICKRIRTSKSCGTLFGCTALGMITWVILSYVAHSNALLRASSKKRRLTKKRRKATATCRKARKTVVLMACLYSNLQVASSMGQAMQALLQQSQQTSQVQELARPLQQSTLSGSQTVSGLAAAAATYA